MAPSPKTLARDLNNLQKNLDTYQTLVMEGKDVEFNKEQVLYYREEVKRVRTALLNTSAVEEDDVEEPTVAAPVQGAVAGKAKPQMAPGAVL